MAITLISNIKQANNGTFALIDSNDIYGGLYHVDSIEEMNVLPIVRLKQGMLCYVAGTTNAFYQYQSSSWVLWKMKFDTSETFTDLNNKTIIEYIKNNSSSISTIDIDYKAAISNLQGQIDAITGTSSGGDATTIEGLNSQLSSLKTLIGKEAEGQTAATGLIKDIRQAEADIDALQITIGDSASGLVKQINTNTSNISTNSSDIAIIKGTGVGSINKSLVDAKAYSDSKIAELVDSAPETLNTLKELSDALGNDANFATTVATQIGTKASQTDLTLVQDKLTGIDTTVVSYVNSKDSTMGTRVGAIETSLGSSGSMGTRVGSLETSMATIKGNDTTEGSMAKLKSDLTNTIATTISNLNLAITSTDTNYSFALKLSDQILNTAILQLETVTETEINEILNALV